MRVSVVPPLAMRDAEVRDLGFQSGADEYVRRLEVAVHDALAVRVVDPARHLLDDRDGGAEVEAPRAEELAERLALHELHDERAATGVLMRVVERHDVRGLHLRDGLGLAPESRERLGVEVEALPQLLERDLALQLVVEGAIDDGHAALAELLEALVAVRLGARGLAREPLPALALAHEASTTRSSLSSSWRVATVSQSSSRIASRTLLRTAWR